MTKCMAAVIANFKAKQSTSAIAVKMKICK